LLGAAAAALLGYFFGARQEHAEPPVFHRLTFDRGFIDAARFSSDGHTIVYSAAWNGAPPAIFTTRAGASESRALGYADTGLLALSSSDELALSLHFERPEELYWSAGLGTLARAPLAGGEPRQDLEEVMFADFRRDGQSLAVVRRHAGMTRLEYPAGKPLYETAAWIADPRIAPSGDRIAFLDYATNSTQAGSVAMVDLQGRKTTLARGFVREQGLAWSPRGDEVWFTAARSGSARALYAVTLEGKERLLLRVPGALTILDVGRDGRALLAEEKLRREVYGRAPGDTAERDLSWLDFASPQGLSADGALFTFGEFGDAAQASTTYVRKTDGSAPVRLADAETFAISPDGRWVLAQTVGEPLSRPLVLLPTGPGQSRLIATEPMNYELGGFAPDGKRLVLVGSRPGHGRQVFVQSIDGGAPRPVTPEGTAPGESDYGLSISPDSRFVVVRDRAGSAFLWPLDGGSPRPILFLKNAGEGIVGFTADSQGVWICESNPLPARISRADLATGQRHPSLELTPRDPAGATPIDNLLMTPDGRGYVYAFVRRFSDLYLVDGLR